MLSTVVKNLKEDKGVVGFSEFIKDRLYFATFKNKSPQDTETAHFFTEDDDDDDVGRVSVSSIVRYCERVNRKLASGKLSSKVLVQFSSGSEKRRALAAVLIGVYSLLFLNMDADQVSEKLDEHTTISIKEKLTALEKVLAFGFVDIQDLNVAEFNSLDRIALSWVIPDKLLLFYGPLGSLQDYYVPPRYYLKYFKLVGVKTIVRIWHNKYDANPFVGMALDHYDLGMSDVTASDAILDSFLELCESSPGAVVVHCRERIGCSGSLISALLVKNYRMTPGEATAWVCCTTSETMMNSQIKWLKKKEKSLREEGDAFREAVFGSADQLPSHDRGIYSYRSYQKPLREEESVKENDAEVSCQRHNSGGLTTIS